MPGSTSATADQKTPKAKVTAADSSGGTNGIFVRPVAVAGIFRPAEESNKPPSLPEKRRFSALSGDLRPCGGAPSEDFARRRQSWVVEQPKDAPFGQALLRKTPRNHTGLPPQTPEPATNGSSSHKDTAGGDGTAQLPTVEEKSLGNSKSKSESVSLSKASSSGKESVNEAVKVEKTQVSLQVNKDETKLASQSLSKSQNCVSYESSSVTSVKISSGSATAVTSTHRISVSETKTSNTGVSSDTADKALNSVDGTKPKKVYGLMKRDVKSEIAPKKAENCVTSELVTTVTESTRKEKSFLKKDSQSETSSKSENLDQKAVSTLDSSSGSKTKVFGLNKLNWKKETGGVKLPETDLVSKTKGNTLVNKNSNEIAVNKPSETKSSNKSIENSILSQESASKNVVKPLVVDVAKSKAANELNEFANTRKASDSKAIAKTASDSLNKVSYDKTGNKPEEVTVVNKTSEIKFSPKTPETKTVTKPLETNSDKNANKLSDSKNLNKSIEFAPIESKVFASKNILKPLEVDKTKGTNELNETVKTDKASDSKTIAKTVPNFSNKISSIKTDSSKTSEIKLAPKTFEAKLVSNPVETITTNKLSETKIISNLAGSSSEVKAARYKISSKLQEKIGSKDLETKPVHKQSLTESKVSDSADLSKKSETAASIKTAESKDVNKELDVGSVSKDVTDSNSDPSKAAVPSSKINEFQKAQSPPKDFRTVRRTSDVIAARIQNIFSNISTPEKPPPILSKKSKVFGKNNANSSSTAEAENKTTDSLNAGVQNTSKQTADKNSSVDLKKNETQHISEYKSDAASTTEEVIKKSSLVEKEGIKDEKCSDGDSNLERKYNAKTSAADHSGLKKESKLAPESSNVSQSCKIAGVTNAPRVKTETQLGKADSKTELSINAAPSKTLGEKSLNIGGKVPTKKDLKSLEGTVSLKATNENDRKSSDSTAPLKTVSEDTHKEPMLKTEPSNTCAGSGEKIQKSVFTSSSGNTSSSSSANVKINYSISKKFESGGVPAKESSSVKTPLVSTNANATPARKASGDSEKILPTVNEIKKAAPKLVSSSVETTQLSKIEVAKITPSPVPSPVPTVNVLFRTKSPQSSATKEENRRKVVVETSAGTSPSVINAPQIPEKLHPKVASPESVQEALKAVESAQNSLNNSSRLPLKHSIVNLKREELAAVNLSAADSNGMPPNNANDKCASVEEDKTDVSESVARTVTPVPPLPQTDKILTVASDASATQTTPGAGGVPKPNGVFSASETNIPSRDLFSSDAGHVLSESRINVVDLDEWTRKFQTSEPPRAPLRRRAQFRESLPPSAPPSRFGSLPRYVPRSPSQSCLSPQRYSYTEMLSKVCSMGVLPRATDPFRRSVSSLSSSSQVSELWSELSEEQSNATHTAEMLESETTERMRLEKEVHELQNRYSQVQLRSDKMEMEMMEARVYRSSEINGDLSEDEDAEANSSLYKQKYERAVRDMEIMKRRIQQQHEEEMEQKNMLKKASDKRLAEALEDVEEERQVANQWKRKAQKLGSELQDLRLMLEEQMARNGELEKKQRRFDAELSSAQEEIKKERILREKFSREKDQALHEKYSIEQDLQSTRLDVDTLHEKINQLNRELDELTLSSKGEEEVTQLKRAKQELERKSRDQEEELEELAAQVGMLEQAKLRLEMSLEKVRQEHRREASVREEEIEEIRASFSKKIKNLEAQLESEQEERHQLLKQKHEVERRLYEMADQPPPQDPEVERRLRRDLKRTKALLRDAQSMLEHTREGQSGKTLIRQLKNQLEDSEFAKAAAVKARQAVEAELHDCQTQLEEATRVKNEVESRCLQLSREKSAIQTQLEEAEEEMAEVMKKYKAVVAQMSIDQKTLSEQNQQIADLETEKQMLKDQLSEVSHKFEHLAGQSEDTHKVHRLDGKVRDLESKLELEQTTRSRLEHQIARLKEQNERVREECESLRNKENQAQEGVRRLQRQIRDLRDDYSALQQKEAEAYRKQHELEMALENTETDLQVTKNDLRLACQRIQDLQNALEDDLDSGTDVPDDSGSDSDDSFELSVLRNQSVTPTQRCDSAGSNYSLASEGIRSRGSSFSHELSAFSSRNDAEPKDHNGLSGVNAGSHLLALERDQAV